MAHAGGTTTMRERRPETGAVGRLADLRGAEVYRIAGYDRMAPFLMSVVSESDLWMFISSTGGLTAGRARPELCLFPYETDDRLHRCAGTTGPRTVIRIGANGHAELWEPFTGAAQPGIRRSLSKSVLSCFVEFEEHHEGLGLTFRSRWSPSDRFGFVRTASIDLDAGATPLTLEILDGLQNIMPAGVELVTQQRASTLADAYKRTELDPQTGMAIYSLEAMISDRPEPSESLRASVVWSTGFDGARVLLTSRQVDTFRAGAGVEPETLRTGERGAYLLVGTLTLAPGESRTWDIVADVNLTQDGVVALRRTIREGADLRAALRTDIAHGLEQLERIVASADGSQATADRVACAHHRSNVLFNTMRGGVFANGYVIDAQDFEAFVETRNRLVARRREVLLKSLPERLEHPHLLAMAIETGDADLIRLCHEYLPLTFSRRHGDPSRPWNAFNIRVRARDGRRLLNYEGNWRDIFQNWEALCESFPWFTESVVAKFVNASTVDGFNPYRIGRDGIGWEESDPSDPWSNIGYWGDHQIVYLLRLLESSRRHRPAALREMLHREAFSYADVPYRIRPYEALLENPKSTIEYDEDHAARIEERVAAIGADGRLVPGETDTVLHVNLIEKLLVPALSKLSNMVSDGGIWMNTQRPEWNDANNALVGQGLSMVTLCHLRRYLSFCIELLLGEDDERPVRLSAEVATWFDGVLTGLTESLELLEGPEIADEDRRRVMDRLGSCFSDYRERVYAHGLGGVSERPVRAIADLCRIARHHVDHAIRANRRADGLFQSYNLLILSRDERRASVDRLSEMLEGQVAALNSGALRTEEALELIDRLFASPLYRHDQRTFMLYPERDIRSFLEKNVAPAERVRESILLLEMLNGGDSSVIVRDAEGRYRFNSDFRSIHDLRRALARLEGDERWAELVRDEGALVREIYEEVFHHHAFTGRSGTMYKYEGIGCVYWHMVSKLILSVQELFFEADERPGAGVDGTRPDLLAQLARAYYHVRDGLGFNKTPDEHGAIPIDPYSHTPRHVGAQQPGMTGQVKEGVLIRLGELGVQIGDGRVRFRPRLLRTSEFLSEARAWEILAVASERETIELAPGSLGFTLCQTPVVYRLVDGDPTAGAIESVLRDGRRRRVDGDTLEERLSAEVFGRTGVVERIEVLVPRASLFEGWLGD